MIVQEKSMKTMSLKIKIIIAILLGLTAIIELVYLLSLPSRPAEASISARQFELMRKTLAGNDPIKQKQALDWFINKQQEPAVDVLIEYIASTHNKTHIAQAIVKLRAMPLPYAQQQLKKIALAGDLFHKKCLLAAYRMHGNSDDISTIEQMLPLLPDEVKKLALQIANDLRQKTN